MAIRVEKLGMLAVCGGRQRIVFMIVKMVLGGADEVGLAGTYLSCILKDISKSPTHLPRRARIAPW